MKSHSHFRTMLSGIGILALLALPASATSIRLTQLVNDTFQVAEIEAFGGGTNWAASANGGLASASSSGFGGVASRANDGNPSGKWRDGSVWHSATGTGSYIQIDLSGPDVALSLINVYLRTDCCQTRGDDFQLLVTDSTGFVQYDRRITGAGSNDAFASVPEAGHTGAMLGTVLAGLGMASKRRRRS